MQALIFYIKQNGTGFEVPIIKKKLKKKFNNYTTRWT